MKKIISILVAILMICTSLSAFAASAVDNAASRVYFNDLNSIADRDTVTSPFGANTGNPASHSFRNGQLIIKRPAEATKSALTYFYFKKTLGDFYSYGFDIKFSDINKTLTNASADVFTLNPGISNNADYGLTTAWTFYQSGKSIKFTFKPDSTNEATGLMNGTNGKPAIFLGDAALDQDKFYNLKVTVYDDGSTYRKYKAFIYDENGNSIETNIFGEVKDTFYDFYKIDAQIATSVEQNVGNVTIDNLYVESYPDETAGVALSVSDVVYPSDSNSISFSATLPAMTNAAQVYINDQFVEDISVVPGKTDYLISSVLPQGTTFGNLKIEVRGTANGKSFSVNDTTYLEGIYTTGNTIINNTPSSTAGKSGFYGTNFDGAGNLKSECSVEKLPSDSPDYWRINGYCQVDVAPNYSTKLTGIVDFTFDFKTTTKLNQCRIRMTSNDGGEGFIWNGDKGETDKYHYFIDGNGNFGKLGIEYSLTDWNTVKIRADFYNHRYYAWINETLAEEGNFTDIDETAETLTDKTYSNCVSNARVIFTTKNEADEAYKGVVDIDNFKFVEMASTKYDTASVIAKYTNSTATYAGTPLPSINLTGFEFPITIPFDDTSINNTNVKIVNSANEVVPATYSFADGKIAVEYSGNVLPGDDYKLVIDRATTVSGNPLGANYEIPFALSSDTTILSPSENENVIGTTNLKLFSYDADKVVFKVDDETVKTFAAPEADGFYEYSYTPTVAGEHIFDAYIYGANGVSLVSSPFYYLVDATMMATSNDMNKSTGMSAEKGATGTYVTSDLDGTTAYKVTSKEGQLFNGIANNDASNSCTTAFTPGGKNAYRKMVSEFDIKPGKNTTVNLEIGFALNGLPYNSGGSGVNYQTLAPRGSSPGIFSADGTILGTSKTFTPDTWYKVRQIIDLDAMTCTWYVDDFETPLVTDNISNIYSGSHTTKEKDADTGEDVTVTHSYPNWKEDIVITNKYKVMVHPINKTEAANGTPATVTLDNFVRYCPVDTPVVDTITAGGAAFANNVIANGTDAVTVTLDKDFNALAAGNIVATVDGEAVGTVSVADTKTFTISGLAGIAAGKKIEVKILKDNLSVPYRDNTAAVQSDYVFYIYVGDTNGVCLLPLAVESETGAELWAYSKYISGSSSDLNTYLIMTEYANDDKTLVSQTNFAPVKINAGKVGAVSGYLSGIKKAEGCNVMLWNTDFAPILEAGALAQ